jgi:hypothetical protein
MGRELVEGVRPVNVKFRRAAGFPGGAAELVARQKRRHSRCWV